MARMTKHPSLNGHQDFSTQTNKIIVENNNLLATGEAKPWTLCIKPLKVWSCFSWVNFILPWRYCNSWQTRAPPAKCCQSLWSGIQPNLKGWSLEVELQEAKCPIGEGHPGLISRSWVALHCDAAQPPSTMQSGLHRGHGRCHHSCLQHWDDGGLQCLWACGNQTPLLSKQCRQHSCTEDSWSLTSSYCHYMLAQKHMPSSVVHCQKLKGLFID